jgi:cation:H+ antiporter
MFRNDVEPILTITYLAGGLVALYFGAEWLVRGASSLARRMGVSPLLVGLTVVAYGTSTPELVVSLAASLKGQGSLAIGNALGSNIFNTGFILGLTALISPLRVQLQLLKIDAPIMVGVAGLFAVLFRDFRIGRGEALILLVALAAYTMINIQLARRQTAREIESEYADGVPVPSGPWWLDVVLIVFGLLVLPLGAHLFVQGAVGVARAWGVSEAVIGLTVVAAGTSLPELAASLVAACRRQADIALGNIIGSNIYNLLAILGVAGIVTAPLEGAGIRELDVWAMVLFCAVLLPLAWTGFTLRRWEGLVLLAGYGAYLACLWPL